MSKQLSAAIGVALQAFTKTTSDMRKQDAVASLLAELDIIQAKQNLRREKIKYAVEKKWGTYRATVQLAGDVRADLVLRAGEALDIFNTKGPSRPRMEHAIVDLTVALAGVVGVDSLDRETINNKADSIFDVRKNQA